MAIDAGGIQIAVALTAACRTPVANLGIRTRPRFEVWSTRLCSSCPEGRPASRPINVTRRAPASYTGLETNKDEKAATICCEPNQGHNRIFKNDLAVSEKLRTKV
jgi:hypothetical protein